MTTPTPTSCAYLYYGGTLLGQSASSIVPTHFISIFFWASCCSKIPGQRGNPLIEFILVSSITLCAKVFMVASEKDTGGFATPSVTVFPDNGWKKTETMEKCYCGAQNCVFFSVTRRSRSDGSESLHTQSLALT